MKQSIFQKSTSPQNGSPTVPTMLPNVLIHEMVHYSNYLANIRDCSSSGYHNRKFKVHAEEVGLTCERADDGKNRSGWAYTRLSPELKVEVDTFQFNQGAFRLFRDIRREKKAPGEKWRSGKQRSMVKWGCSCTKVWVWPTVKVNARCQACGEVLLPSPVFTAGADIHSL